jgi:predicted transcriptional regulator
MAFNPKKDANAGNISIKHRDKLWQLADKTKRKRRAMLEWLIDQEVKRMEGMQ